MNPIICICKEKEAGLLALRRELHRVPEIGGNLPQTRKIVCDFLDARNIPYTLNPNDDGVVAEIRGKKAGKTLAFRADMDGLHVNEPEGKEYRSVIAGQMHGCGHDAHTAILLVTAELLNENRDSFCGTVRFLFQSGEETGTGAKEMIAVGALNGVDAIISLHVGNLAGDEHEAGDFIVLPGPVSAGKDKFTITVRGKGTHSAFPEKGIDPILIAARIVTACEEIQSRFLAAGTAAVLSFGSFHAGKDHNTIPEIAELYGSIRVQDEETRDRIGNRMKCIAENTARAFGGEAVVDLKKGSKTVMNDEKLSAVVADSIKKLFGDEKCKTSLSHALMGSDDFANYASRIPAVYFFLHTNNSEKKITEANHNPYFDVDESVLWKGVAAYLAVAYDYLK